MGAEIEGLYSLAEDAVMTTGVSVADLEFSARNVSSLTQELNKLGLMHSYTYDTANGQDRSPREIYNLTLQMSVGVAALDSGVDFIDLPPYRIPTMTSSDAFAVTDVQVFAPALQLKNKKNISKSAFAPQSEARRFALETARLRAIKTLLEDGKISSEKSKSLTSGMDVKEAIKEQEARFNAWESQVRQFQAEPTYLRVRAAHRKAEALNAKLNKKNIASFDRPGVVWEYQAHTKARTYALVATAVVSAVVLSACGGAAATEVAPTADPISAELAKVMGDQNWSGTIVRVTDEQGNSQEAPLGANSSLSELFSGVSLTGNLVTPENGRAFQFERINIVGLEKEAVILRLLDTTQGQKVLIELLINSGIKLADGSMEYTLTTRTGQNLGDKIIVDTAGHMFLRLADNPVTTTKNEARELLIVKLDAQSAPPTEPPKSPDSAVQFIKFSTGISATPVSEPATAESPATPPPTSPGNEAPATQTAPAGLEGGKPGSDEKGAFIELNGIKYRQRDIINPVTGEKTQIWAGSINTNEGLIALYDEEKQSNDLGWNDQIQIQTLVDPRVPGASVVPLMSYIQSDKLLTGKTFSSTFFLEFARSRGVNSPDDSYSLRDVTFDFTSFAGSSEWFIPQKGIQEDSVTLIRRVEDLPVVEGNGVRKVQDPNDSTNYFYVRTYSVNKKLVTEIASTTSLDKLTPKQIAFMALLGPMSVILGEDQVQNNYSTDVSIYAGLATQSSSPYFSFTPRK